MTDLDPKEAKILGDILALTLDDQPGPALAALQKIQQRARQNGITGGALKNIFSRIVGEPAPSAAGGFASGQQRSTIAAQAASISILEQRVAMLQARLNQGEALRRQEMGALAWASRRSILKAAAFGAGTGVAFGGLLMFVLSRPSAIFIPPHVPAPNPPPARLTPPVLGEGDPSVIPAMRDPSDTAPGPQYPADLVKAGREGDVQLLVYVEADGNVAAIGVTRSSGVPEFDLAAQQAVRQWKFRPATRDGVPVANAVPIRIRFVLRH